MRLSTNIVEQAGYKQSGGLATSYSDRYEREYETTEKGLAVLTEGAASFNMTLRLQAMS